MSRSIIYILYINMIFTYIFFVLDSTQWLHAHGECPRRLDGSDSAYNSAPLSVRALTTPTVLVGDSSKIASESYHPLYEAQNHKKINV